MNETYLTLPREDLNELRQLANETRRAIFKHMQYVADAFDNQYEESFAGRPKPSTLWQGRNSLYDYSPDAPEASVSPIAALDVFHMIGRLEMEALEYGADDKGELFARMAATMNATPAVKRLRSEYAKLSEEIAQRAGDRGDWRDDPKFFELFVSQTFPPTDPVGPREPIWRRLAKREVSTEPDTSRG